MFPPDKGGWMAHWMQEERRQHVRYEVALFARIVQGLAGEEIAISSHDISAKGVGLIVDRPLMLGEIVDITFVMPDNAEQIETRGMVVWVQPLGPGQSRAGVEITDRELRPIPMVLRSINVRKSRYSC